MSKRRYAITDAIITKEGTDILIEGDCQPFTFARLHVLISDDIRHYIETMGAEKIFTGKAYFCFKTGEGDDQDDYYVFYNSSHLQWNFINHELEHLKHAILVNAGVPRRKCNDEHDAYLLDWLTAWLIRNFRRAGIVQDL